MKLDLKLAVRYVITGPTFSFQALRLSIAALVIVSTAGLVTLLD